MSALQLAVDDEAHWSGLTAALGDGVTEGMEAGATGLVITAPERVVIGARETLPLGGIRVATFEEVARAPLHAAMVVAACLENGEVRAAQVAEPPEALPVEDGEEPGDGLCGESFSVDLFGALGLPQKRSTWVVRVILRDQVSNAVTIAIGPPRSRFIDPAAEELIRELLRRPILRPLHPRPSLGPGLPVYEPLPETPKLPAQPGIALKIPRAHLLEGKPQLLVHGAFRARILPRDVRPPPAADAPKLRGPRATAVVPMALLALSTARHGAEITQLVIPSYQPLEGAGDAFTGTGAFAFDYFQLKPAPAESQTIFFYALAGPLISAAAPCALVNPAAVQLD